MHIDQVERYFSSRASGYQCRSARFPWSWIRLRELALVLELLGDVRGADVLELGSGSGFYTCELLARGARHIWAVDVSAPMLAALPAGSVTAVLSDAATVTLERRFTVLLSTGMLEFVADPIAVLRNAAAHAEPNARCVLLTPRRNVFGLVYREFHRTHGLPIRLFDRPWLQDASAATGWHVVAHRAAAPFSLVTCLQRN
jgi:SAM-dependent methyltransferase